MNEMMRILNAYKIYYKSLDLWFNICRIDENDPACKDETEWQITWDPYNGGGKYITKYFRMNIVYHIMSKDEGMSCETLASIIFGDNDLFDELVRMVSLGLDYRSKYSFQNMSTDKYEDYDYDIKVL